MLLNTETQNIRNAFSKVTIVYMSPNGSTRKCAKIIAEQIECEVKLVDLAITDSREVESIISKTTLLGIGSPTFHLSMLEPVKNFLERIQTNPVRVGQARYAFCFTTYGHVNSGKTLLNMAKILHRKHFTVLGALILQAKHFYQKSIKFPKQEDQDMIIKFCETLKDRVNEPVKWRILSKRLNYQYLKAKIVYPLIRVFGNSFRVPKFHYYKDLCTFCGLCEKSCPTKVITVSELPNKRKGCIFCFNCVMVCPTGAIYSDIDEVKKVLKFNSKILHEEILRAII